MRASSIVSGRRGNVRDLLPGLHGRHTNAPAEVGPTGAPPAPGRRRPRRLYLYPA